MKRRTRLHIEAMDDRCLPSFTPLASYPVGATAVIGLATAGLAVTSTGLPTPSADTSMGHEARIAVPAAPRAAAEPLESGLDPWLQQINRGAAHQG